MCYAFSDILVCVCWEKPKVFRGKRKNNIGGSRLCSRRRVSSSPSSCWGVGVLGPSFLTPLTLIDRSRGGEQVRVPSIRGPLFPYSSGSRRLLSLSYTFLWHFVDVCFSAFLSFVLVRCFISYSSESLFFPCAVPPALSPSLGGAASPHPSAFRMAGSACATHAPSLHRPVRQSVSSSTCPARQDTYASLSYLPDVCVFFPPSPSIYFL